MFLRRPNVQGISNNWCQYIREQHRNVIRSKFCCRKSTISEEIWTISLCQICFKMCISESGLLRHVKSRDSEYLPPNEKFSILKFSFDIFLLKSFIEKSAANLAEDACYPEDVYGYWNRSILRGYLRTNHWASRPYSSK